MSTNTPKLLTALEVAQRLRFDEYRAPTEAVRRLRRSGRVQAVRVGRQWLYPEDIVEQFVLRLRAQSL